MELSREFNFSFDKLDVLAKSHLSQLDTKGELPALVDFVLILHVRMHVSEEKLLLVFVGKPQTDTLIGLVPLHLQVVVRFHDVVENLLVQHLDFHFKGVVGNHRVFEAPPLIWLSHEVNGLHLAKGGQRNKERFKACHFLKLIKIKLLSCSDHLITLLFCLT